MMASDIFQLNFITHLHNKLMQTFWYVGQSELLPNQNIR